LHLEGQGEKTWSLVADVNQDHSQIAALINLLCRPGSHAADVLEQDIARGSAELVSLVAAADGLQHSADPLTTAHHFANVTFNIMRGGIFSGQGMVEKEDLLDFIRVHNRRLINAPAPVAEFVQSLPDSLPAGELYSRAAATGVPELIRLCYEYLPLTFSRRHGDPSRPWNQFSINLRGPDGRRRLDYQGNWRDIFQNWEPLVWSYPMFIPGVIARFLNATTADGYNPYKVTRGGIEWEVPAPNHPWANIGYWSDHQIIYLQKLLELAAEFQPDLLPDLLNQQIFSYADVPYRLRPYADLVRDPVHTIDFDWEQEARIERRTQALGSDGKLITDENGAIVHVALAEKLLGLLLAKLANFVPSGGIWMNTQRPEWNDANNALVGKGLSVVTTAYLRRFIVFCRDLIAGHAQALHLTSEVTELLAAVQAVLEEYQPTLAQGFDDSARRAFMDALGTAASNYRWTCYQVGFSGDFDEVAPSEITAMLDLALAYVDQTLRDSRRPDGLYHAYNLLRFAEAEATVDPLYEMLEGQVAILSSGVLTSAEALGVLHSVRASSLYRADQHSYILYPDRELRGFLHKNQVAQQEVRGFALVTRLEQRKDQTLLRRNENGVYHFPGSFRNAQDVAAALQRLSADPELAPLVEAEGAAIVSLFETTFSHHTFTGRSGTFFAYEGLGSIYWHMVSKLLLAAQENFWWAKAAGESPAVCRALAAAYYDVRAGIGFSKQPAIYGAFPTDPYSHTPKGQGAKQPGMTGQVKEEILTRLGELGVHVHAGTISFDPALLRKAELLAEPSQFSYLAIDGRSQTIDLPANSLAFTLCQVPIIVMLGDSSAVEVFYAGGSSERILGHVLSHQVSSHLFQRDGIVVCLRVAVGPSSLADGVDSAWQTRSALNL
jgi:hypothetical protein